MNARRIAERFRWLVETSSVVGKFDVRSRRVEIPTPGQILEIDQAMVRKYEMQAPNKHPYVRQEPSGYFSVVGEAGGTIYANRDRLCSEGFVSGYSAGFAGYINFNPFKEAHACGLAYSDGWTHGQHKRKSLVEAEAERKAKETTNVVTFNFGEHAGQVPVSDFASVTINGQPIHKVTGVEMSAGVGDLTEITLSFYASVSPATQEQLIAALEAINAKSPKSDLMAAFLKDIDKDQI